MSQSLSVNPGDRVELKDLDARFCGKDDKESAVAEFARLSTKIDELSYRLYAENRRALLLILQGMDTAGKDGAIRHIMQSIHPLTGQAVSFKQPSLEELDHDFLWRIHRECPRKGNVGIFNRSQYEDVLIVRVHNLVPKDVWQERYEKINAFEKLLVDSGTTIVKCFLHISKDEQRERLQARLDDPTKTWKFSKGDLAERAYWDDYQHAYEDALTKCNTKHAPWHIVPADRKWYRNLCLSRLMAEALQEMDPQFPPAEEGLDGIKVE